MTDLNIKKPCIDCPLFVGSGEDLLDIYDKRLLPMCRDGIERALGCKHPWRVANERFGGEPNTPQRVILSQLIEVRGKNPVDYGLDPSEVVPVSAGLNGWIDPELTGIVEDDHRQEVIGIIANELTIAFMATGSESDILKQIEATMSEFASDPEIPTEWVDEALKIAQARVVS